MAGKSDFLEQAVASWIGGTTFPAAPTTLTVSLHTGDPGDDGLANEVAAVDYARASVAAATLFPSPTGGVATSAAVVDFGTTTSAWGTVTHGGIWDGTDFLYSGALTVSLNITSGTDVTIPIGSLTVSET